MRKVNPPEEVTVTHPEIGEELAITFDANLLAESLRQLMYSGERGARVPLLLIG